MLSLTLDMARTWEELLLHDKIQVRIFGRHLDISWQSFKQIKFILQQFFILSILFYDQCIRQFLDIRCALVYLQAKDWDMIVQQIKLAVAQEAKVCREIKNSTNERRIVHSLFAWVFFRIKFFLGRRGGAEEKTIFNEWVLQGSDGNDQNEDRKRRRFALDTNVSIS